MSRCAHAAPSNPAPITPIFNLPPVSARAPQLYAIALGAANLAFVAALQGLALIAADLAAAVAGVAAIVHGARRALWSPLRTRRNPLLWILHASYAWIVVHFALFTFAYWRRSPGRASTGCRADQVVPDAFPVSPGPPAG